MKGPEGSSVAPAPREWNLQKGVRSQLDCACEGHVLTSQNQHPDLARAIKLVATEIQLLEVRESPQLPTGNGACAGKRGSQLSSVCVGLRCYTGFELLPCRS